MSRMQRKFIVGDAIPWHISDRINRKTRSIFRYITKHKKLGQKWENYLYDLKSSLQRLITCKI